MISYGFSIRHWQMIEAGRPSTLFTLLRICEAFDVQPEQLVAGRLGLCVTPLSDDHWTRVFLSGRSSAVKGACISRSSRPLTAGTAA